MCQAPEKYGVTYGTILNKISNVHQEKHEGRTALSNEFEEVLKVWTSWQIGMFHLMALICDASYSLTLSPLGNIKADLGMICQD